MPRPATVFSFATNTLNNGTFSTPNKKPLSPTKLQDGFLVETLHRGELNTLFHDIGEWITHFADDLNGQKIEFGTTKTEIPVIDGDIISTRANVVKQVIGNSSTKITNNLEVVANNDTTKFSVNKETGAITAPSLTGNAGSSNNWKTARKLTLSGAVTGNVNIDGSGDATLSTALANLSGDKITSGTVAADRVGALPASKVTTGSFHVDRIPSLNASKINAGTLGTARIPSLAASKITSGTLAVARIPSATVAEVGTSSTKYPNGSVVNEYVNQAITDSRQFTGINLNCASFAATTIDSELLSIPRGAQFSPDGMHVFSFNTGSTPFGLHRWDLQKPFNFEGAVYFGSSTSTNYMNSLRGWFLTPDGTRFITVRSGSNNQTVAATLSTPFDPTTMSQLVVETTDSTNLDSHDIHFSPDGLNAYVAYTSTARVKRYLCTATPFSLVGATLLENIDGFGGLSTIAGFTVTGDGLDYLVYSSTTDRIHHYSSHRFGPDQLGGATNIQMPSFDTGPVVTGNDVIGLSISSDNSKLSFNDGSVLNGEVLRVLHVASLTS